MLPDRTSFWSRFLVWPASLNTAYTWQNMKFINAKWLGFFSVFSLKIANVFFFLIGKWRVLQICLEKTQVSLFCCSLLSTFLSHIRHFTTPNGIKKKKLLLMQSYVAMLFYFFIKSKQYSCNNMEKEYKIIHKWCESEILFCFIRRTVLVFWGFFWKKKASSNFSMPGIIIPHYWIILLSFLNHRIEVSLYQYNSHNVYQKID